MIHLLSRSALAALSASVISILPFGATHAQTNVRERVAAAVETVEGACASDIQNFCGKVTRGEGRVLGCMQAHDDQLSRRCQWALYRVSRHLDGALNRVERIAEACWNDIETQCRDAERIGQCVLEKRGNLSQACQTVVGGLRNAVQGLAAMRGLPVTGSDNADLGEVVDVKRGPDGAVQSLDVEMGRRLGIGGKVVTISRDKFEQIGDRIRLLMKNDEVNGLPEAKGK